MLALSEVTARDAFAPCIANLLAAETGVFRGTALVLGVVGTVAIARPSHVFYVYGEELSV